MAIKKEVSVKISLVYNDHAEAIKYCKFLFLLLLCVISKSEKFVTASFPPKSVNEIRHTKSTKILRAKNSNKTN